MNPGVYGLPYNPDENDYGFAAVDHPWRVASAAVALGAANRAFFATVAPGYGKRQCRYIRLRVGTSSGNIEVGVFKNGPQTPNTPHRYPLTRLATSGVIACPAGVADVSLDTTLDILPGMWLMIAADNNTATFYNYTSVGASSTISVSSVLVSTTLPVPSCLYGGGLSYSNINYVFALVAH